MLDQVEAVLFDLDGTLVDSMWMWGKVDAEFFENEGMKMPDDFQRQIEGMSFRDVTLYMKEKYHFKLSPEEIGKKLNEMGAYKYEHEVKIKDGVHNFLQYLKETGIKTAICSSTSRFLVSSCIKANNIEQYIDIIKTSCDVPKGKPAPDIYLAASKELGISPNHCLVFEDIPNGIRAGKSAGMRVCAVYDIYSVPFEPEKKNLADYFIQSFNDVLNNTYETLH